MEIPEIVNYGEWDKSDFLIPVNFSLNKNSFLHEAIDVFYAAGGYDFFKVINPEKYATNWLDFIGGLYSDIVDGKFQTDGQYHKNPLSETAKKSLKEQGVPDIFTADIR